MKIAMIGGRDINSVGGIEYWMKHLSRHLAARGHQVTVYCESDRDAVREEDGVRVVSVKAPKSRYLCKIFASWRATRMAVRLGVDLIHYNVWPAALWRFLAERKGITTVLMGHGFEWKRSKYNAIQRWILRRCEACAARSARHIVLCSQEQTDWYVRHYGCAGKAVTIPSAVDLPPLDQPSVDLPVVMPETACSSVSRKGTGASSISRMGPGSSSVAGRPLTLLYMGRLSPEKNIDTLIRAFASVSRETNAFSDGPRPRLLLAGSLDRNSAYGRRVLSLVEESDAVTYLGEVYGEEKERLLREASLFCLPSSVEGLSVALLEAASHRIPILASDIPSNCEVLAEAAFWVKPEDPASLEAALRACFARLGEAEIRTLTEAAYERVAEHFTWERSAARYESYIRSL